jgi:uncharacterized protein YeaO (DUF488 family)
MRMRFQAKRIYEVSTPKDGRRILIDRLWPRGLTKEAAGIDYWAKSIAPSNELRKWYKHEPEKWTEFRDRYFRELDANPEGMAAFRAELGKGLNTILFASKEDRLNNAAALIEYLERPDRQD